MKRIILAAFLMAAMVPLTGCGGGGGSGSSPTVGPLTPQYVTRANEAIYTQDAKILAARVATSPWLSETDAKRFDADLSAIRAKYPQVANNHATPDYVLTQILVRVRKDSPWIGRWQSGQLMTGIANLDHLLFVYGVTGVSQPLDAGGDQVFTLTFGQSMNMTDLADIFRQADAYITSADVNHITGGSTRISFTAQSDGSRRYSFQAGAGDCLTGCIANHTWQFTIAPDGRAITLVESGAPLGQITAP